MEMTREFSHHLTRIGGICQGRFISKFYMACGKVFPDREGESPSVVHFSRQIGEKVEKESSAAGSFTRAGFDEPTGDEKSALPQKPK